MDTSKATTSGSSRESVTRQRRRTSSVGPINLGDSTAGLATLTPLKQQTKASEDRIKELSGKASTSMDLVKKILIAYQELSFRHTWLNPLLIIIVVVGSYLLSEDKSESNVLHKYIFLSYKIDQGEGKEPVYGKGWKDFCFVFFYMIFFTFYREIWMQCVLRPLAKRLGLRKGKIMRFMEQTYCLVYYGVSGPLGLYVMYHTPIWYFKTTAFYEEYPHKTHDFYFKLFYLLQAAFWAQQAVVLCLQLEKPRKDFKELVFHHIVTIALIWTSYRFHFTWMGLAVYITMDVSDFFLALSKTLNYLDSPLQLPVFVTFIFVWTYLRHYLNIKILISVITEFLTIGETELNWEDEQYKCWISQIITFALLFCLQLVNLYWLFLIMRILVRYLGGAPPADERSEDEDEETTDSPTSGSNDLKDK